MIGCCSGPNLPTTYEMHFGVPMEGAVLNTLNIRHDAHNVSHFEAFRSQGGVCGLPILRSYNGNSQEPS